MKVVIVGASHAGIAAAQRVVAKYADAEVTLIDRRTTHLSFIGAGAHMYLNGEIESPAATDYCEDTHTKCKSQSFSIYAVYVYQII